MVSEFRQFIARGNVMDLAVGVIIGGAFGKIVTSAVDDLIMPPLGLVLGKVDFTNLYIPLDEKVTKAIADAGTSLPLAEAKQAGPVLAYGSFINTTVQFIILAFVIFNLIKLMNRLQAKPVEEPAPAAPPEPTAEEKLLTEIRDLLKK